MTNIVKYDPRNNIPTKSFTFGLVRKQRGVKDSQRQSFPYNWIYDFFEKNYSTKNI